MSNKMIKSILIVSLVFNTAVIATVAVGWIVRDRTDGTRSTEGRNREIPIHEHGARLSKCIGLSGKRAECFMSAMAESVEEAGAIRGELEEARIEFYRLIHEEQPDREAILSKVEEISILQGKLEKILVERILDSRDVLDHEEEQKLLNLIRCSTRPGCMDTFHCPGYGKRKEGEQ
jgi:hypothetical protein